jgi:hypothetical protein
MFGKHAYRELVASIRRAGYSFGMDWDAPGENTVIMRHDIDFSTDYARVIAELESDLDMRSTYFFMLSANSYSLPSRHNADNVRAVRDAGHRVSLHYDPTVYDDPVAGFRAERKMFEDLFEVAIDIVSVHRPGDFLNDNNRDLDGCAHTYQDRYFHDMKYLSDSGGRFVTPLVDEFLAGAEGAPLQLLTHPVWWQDERADPTATLSHWIDGQDQFLRADTRRNCKTFEG